MPTGYAAIIKFWVADHLKNQAPPPPERWATSVKIEIILYEKMLFPVSLRPITHAYSDKLTLADQTIPCYDLKEVMSEKLRALIQRSYSAPRDYFDIWYLSHKLTVIEWPVIVKAFHKKMKFKNLKFTGIDQFLNDDVDKKLTGAWKNSMAHQIPHEQLPPYSQVNKSYLYCLKRYLLPIEVKRLSLVASLHHAIPRGAPFHCQPRRPCSNEIRYRS